MRYTPKKLKGNVNISKKTPLKEFFKLLCSLLIIVIVLYVFLGLAVDIIAPRLPSSIESVIASLYKPMYKNKTIKNKGSEKITILLEDLVKTLNNNETYTVSVIENKEANALALPGNHIIIYSKLIEELSSEPELSYVLAHELGHFYHKDHLKALGRRLIVLVFSNAVFGQDSSLSRVIGDSLMTTEMRFSQRQEQAADLFAMDLLFKHYGDNIGALGAISFLKRSSDKRFFPDLFTFFRTHPHPDKRIKVIKNKTGWPMKENIRTLPLDDNIKHMFSADKN
jgi:Zn-dependent protease with chaperone function